MFYSYVADGGRNTKYVIIRAIARQLLLALSASEIFILVTKFASVINIANVVWRGKQFPYFDCFLIGARECQINRCIISKGTRTHN